ncbi:MAG: YHS domain-containing protein [Planctomycetaceae bacterium]
MDVPRISLAVLFCAVMAVPSADAQSKHGFQSNFEAAEAQAKATNKPLLVHFYANYCPPCRRMEAEVFSNRDFGRKLSGMVVAVKVNTELRPDLAQRFQVERIPHDRLLSPTGKELSRAGGFIPGSSYLAMVNSATQKFVASQPKPAKAQPAVRNPQPSAASASQVYVGLDGYCPVELGKNRKWIRGEAKFEVEYKGIEYRFASKANYDRFKKYPEQFAPQVLGCDPVVLASSHKAIPGLTDYGAFFDGKLYLFQTSDSRTKFKKNPLKYIRIQHALDASKIERVVVR